MRMPVSMAPVAIAFFFSLRLSGLMTKYQPLPTDFCMAPCTSSYAPYISSTPPTLHGSLPLVLEDGEPSPSTASVAPVHHGMVDSR